ncbi:helix-turn-helix domain-containing protein [Candidatus Bathyarchaeota archaeon A05DMB-2]|nr:helix-turn-helix domain-containing protein [Candidatus Bathyarchaeota archaeon A05DMB-2]
MPNSEEEIYSLMFSSLKHPQRRKILRMLAERPMTFSELLEELAVSSSHLTYHLENLGELVVKLDNGKYKLSSFGEASVATMKGVEEAPTAPKRHFAAFSPRWKTIFAVLIIASVLFASISMIQYAYIAQLSNNHARLQADLDKVKAENEQLLTWSSPTEKVLDVLQDVVKLDMTKYKATMLSDTVEYRSDLGGVVEELAKYSLTSNESRIDVMLRFRNGHFSRYQLFIDEGTPQYSQIQPSDIVVATREVLERYEAYTGGSYLEDMRTLMSFVNGTESNETILNHTKLVFLTSGDSVRVMLQYTENGVDFSPKSLSFVFENGVLNEILDGWYLFTVENTKVNISSAQAVEIARNAAANFKWIADSQEVSNFTILQQPVSVMFHPSPREGGLALVPYWFVTLYLDKVYPGGVNRINVGVWADTGEVAQINTAGG